MDDIVSYVIGKKKGGVQPTGEIDITQNGITNVSGYATANVQVPEPSGKITISQNGTDIDVSSYATADVSVPAGADLSEYFDTTTSAQGSSNSGGWIKTIKKIPTLTIESDDLTYFFYNCEIVPDFTVTLPVYSCSNAFSGANNKTKKFTLPSITLDYGNQYFNNMFYQCKFQELDLSTLGARNIGNLDLSYMFAYSYSLKKVNLSNFQNNSTIDNAMFMFGGCSSLEEADLSKMDFTQISNYTGMFNSVPANCLIYVKNQTQKDWFTTNFSDLTNVQIKS